MKKSKKGKPIYYCPNCKKDTTHRIKLGGKVCNTCDKINYESV